VGSVADPYPEISWAGSSPAALDIAARYADTFSLSSERIDGTLEVTAQVNDLAARYGRSLRFWHNGNQILAATDAEARATAERIADILEGPDSPLVLDVTKPESVSRKRLMAQAADGDWAEHALYMRIARITGGESVPAFVGTPETVAEGMLAYYEQGIEIFGMDPTCFTEEEVELKRELLRLLHEGAREIDARRAAEASVDAGALVAESVAP
ncbi:MAG TPA: LLM class flavin-dependent oxidoreductase, partial [Actinomycetaceae bacterium]|nr:LLM class flavin-dependent oxidoreductase [Actinomycetaceae bacterium]